MHRPATERKLPFANVNKFHGLTSILSLIETLLRGRRIEM